MNVDGKTVVESYDSSIRDYESRGQMHPGPHYNFSGNQVSGMIVAGTGNQVTQNQVAHPELTDLIKAVVDAACGTEVEDRISKLMAQLELEVDEDEPDETIIDKTLERAEGVATKAGVDLVVQLVMRAANYIHEHPLRPPRAASATAAARHDLVQVEHGGVPDHLVLPPCQRSRPPATIPCWRALSSSSWRVVPV